MSRIADRIRAEEQAKAKKINRRNIFDRVADDQAAKESAAEESRTGIFANQRRRAIKPEEKAQ